MPVNLDREQLTEDFRQTIDATKDGPVFIMDRGRPAFVLQTIEDYYQRNGKQPNIVDLLADPNSAHIDFEPPRFTGPHKPPFEFD